MRFSDVPNEGEDVTVEEEAITVEEPERNVMAEHYHDPALNSYDSGPGVDLPAEHQPAALASQSPDTNRTCCGVYLKMIPRDLTEDGIKNLCKKSGRVQRVTVFEYERTNCAVVIFYTAE